jgi:GntR family transcriptional regulator
LVLLGSLVEQMPDSIYRRIAGDLRDKIESGELAHGSQLPTEIELRKLYEASRNTVRDAIKWLITRGLVETRPGQGRFVVEKILPFVTQLTGDPGTGGGPVAVYVGRVLEEISLAASGI